MKSLQLQVLAPTESPAFQLVTVDLPPPGPHEVQVSVEAASINPIDVKRARGYGRRLLGLKGAWRP